MQPTRTTHAVSSLRPPALGGRSPLLATALGRGLPLWLTTLGMAILVAVAVAWNSNQASLTAAVALVIGLAVALRTRLPRLALSFLGLCLLGYALFGKGFAYIGAAPIFIGELALGLCLLALLLRGRLGLLGRSPLLYLLLLNMGVGLSATLPSLGVYGVDAVRDAVLWAYSLFSVCVAALLVQQGWVIAALRQYIRFVPLFLCAAPVLLLAGKLLGPDGLALPGSSVSLIDLKGGDVAVMLAMIASLLLLGLHRLPELRAAGRALGQKREWIWWLLWLVIAALSIFRVRAGLLAIAAALIVVVLGRAASRWRKPLLALVLGVGLLTVFNVQFQFGEARNTVSVQSLLVNLQSITADSGDANRDGSKSWRLLWWNDIANYTLHGPYFWSGKGYGLNLADADGYQVTDDASLRSPHSAHLNILARSGVPGLLAWATLQLTFAGMLLLAYRRARACGQELWARLNLWTLACWAAFMVNAAFDVYLEGPQGGIWFWSLFGFGVALLEVQRRGAPAQMHARPMGFEFTSPEQTPEARP
ncbi:O-antigen ligase family protein [Deinococcus sp.]|uniref:O-antigen ligase family protein n=1 Tax=Deinococcus sp. TaxID=47478 RepID=UPI003C7D8296